MEVMDVLFSIFELLGTVAFAVSGAMEGVRHRMDLFGVTLLGLVTAIGGGVLRDLVIGQIPPKVFRDSRCAVLAILVALAVFIILKLTQERKPRALARLRDRLYFLSDTLGLAAFTVLGIESAGPGRNTGLLLFVGMITGVGGGVLRDILAGSVPSILRKHIYAVGSNETSARLAGVNVDGVKIAVFMISGLMCGFTSWLYSSSLMAVAAASAGNLFEMDAIAAVVIGGTSMSGGRGKIIGSFLGVLMFKIINNTLVAAKVPTFLTGAISGAIIIIAVLLQNVRKDKK